MVTEERATTSDADLVASGHGVSSVNEPKPPKRTWRGSPSVKILVRNHFSSALQRMSTVAATSQTSGERAANWVLVKGSPEMVATLLVEKPKGYDAAYRRLAEEGMRIIALQDEVAKGNRVGLDITTGDPFDPTTAGVYDNFIVKAQILHSAPLSFLFSRTPLSKNGYRRQGAPFHRHLRSRRLR